jgi:carbamoyltransferase
MGTELDLLVIGNSILRKEDQNPALAEKYEARYDMD